VVEAEAVGAEQTSLLEALVAEVKALVETTRDNLLLELTVLVAEAEATTTVVALKLAVREL
jgi:hypothetical protein